MKTRLLTCLLLILAPFASGQEIKLPAEIAAVPGAWIIVAPEIVSGGKAKFRIDNGLQEVRLDLLFPPEVASQARGKVLQGTTPGRYRIEVWNAKGDVASDIATCWVTITGTVVPPIIPDPPGPVVPPLPPVIAGPRTVLILRESATDTPALARLFNSLQAGRAATYLKSKGHSCFVLDDDADAAKVKAWRDSLMLPIPALAILDKDGKVLTKMALPTTITDDELLEILKKAE